MTDGQADLFLTIYTRAFPRNEFIGATQYGKTDITSMALLLRVRAKGEPWLVIGGSASKAELIMRKVIQHIFDHPYFFEQLELDNNMKLERLKRSRSQDHMTFKDGGSIRILSADIRNRQRVKEALTGEGGANVIVEEASLMPDDVMAMVLRMLGGHSNAPEGTFLLKIGNPFYRNHFHRTSIDPLYKVLIIDYEQALAEGRYTRGFIDEMSKEPFFDILYRCQFPAADAVLEGGWRVLITEDKVQDAFVDEDDPIEPKGKPRLGVDVNRGGTNWTVFVLRYDNIAFVLYKYHADDLDEIAGRVMRTCDEYLIEHHDVQVDDVGVGGGVTDICHAKGYNITGVKEGGSAADKSRFANMKAELFWLLKVWLDDGGKLKRNNDFYQLSVINYKEDSSSRLKLEPKLELQKRGIQSPDVADSLSLTFTNEAIITEDDFAII